MRAPDVIVIGAGIVGAAVAHRLAAEGLDVLVVEGHLGAATDAGMGHLVVIDEPEAEFALSRQSMLLWQQWRPLLDEGSAYSACGTLWVAADEIELGEARAKQARLSAQGVANELLDERALAQAEPMLRPCLAGALRVPGDGVLYAPNAARALLRHAARPVKLLQARVAALAQGAVQLADGKRLHAAAVVLAGGLHSRTLAPELPVVAKKGHLLITERYPGRVHHQLVELGYVHSAHAGSGSSVAFNVQPRPTGQLLVGSSRQFDSENAEVDGLLLARMLRRATQYLPALAQLSAVRCWTGLRPATPDGQPIIGAHPWRRGLWLALGHEGLGTTTAPATAELLAQLMLGRPTTLDARAFAPTRFATSGMNAA